MIKDIHNLRALLAEATPGPWFEDDCSVHSQPLGDARMAAIIAKVEGRSYDKNALHLDPFVATTGQRHEQSNSDACLIPALRNAASELLDAWEAWEALKPIVERIVAAREVASDGAGGYVRTREVEGAQDLLCNEAIALLTACGALRGG